MTGEEFYRKRMDETRWPEDDLIIKTKELDNKEG